MATLGEMLIESRRQAGFTALEVSQRTRIMLSAITALEEDNLSVLPAAGYVRGYLLSYCRLIGCDPQPFLDQYNRQTGTSRHNSMGRLPIDYDADRHRHNEHEMNWKIVAVIAAAIVLIAVGVYLVNGLGKSGLSRLPLIGGETTSTATPGNISEDKRIPFSFTVAAKEGSATEVKIINDGILAYQGALTPGGDKSFDGVLEAVITIANPENAVVIQNGTNIPIQESGELTLTAQE